MTISTAIGLLLWIATIGCGLMAGVYFAFSAFIMTAFGRIGEAQGIAAMNAINVVILASPFMPLFWGTSLVSLALAIIGPLRWGEPGSTAIIAGGIIYVAGTFVVTVAFNVPLNTALAKAGPDQPALWARYLQEWTRWNHARTLASTVAAILFLVGLKAQ